jgi:prepilin-type N-terminal cleavage/methylation domain-containing protein
LFRKLDISNSSIRGFTLLELLVAMSLTTVVMTVVVGQVFMLQRTYMDELGRIRINSNLSSSNDIISMNIRQAGENLSESFPALKVANGASGAPDTLTLRRNLAPEVLTLCDATFIGRTALEVSDAALGESECMPSNVSQLYNVFEAFRTDAGGSKEVFIYNRIAEQGEFITYSAGESVTGEFVLTVSPLEADYPALTTNIYLLEEYEFSVDTLNKTLNLVVDGDSDTSQTVAFSITDFQVEIELADTSRIYELNESSTQDWKDIRQVWIRLTGEEEIRNRTLSASTTTRYFPRNILSR